ncbi:hypothetical protein GCM10027346_14640 [Hymenobacter seoulensis]
MLGGEQTQQFNTSGLQEHEIKIRLARFPFTSAYWDNPCRTLSGGEKMRLLLRGLMISYQAPDLIILDETTNNLDILTATLQDYYGTLLVVSHEKAYLEQLQVERTIRLD